ncbi:AmmeMemoRadiSam system protein B, partial [Candidatus Bipolaricaulota bacterium]|nr:AmmeMemoRadiSam system protein B [Candidatus Bipolaricaulota bacterium]
SPVDLDVIAALCNAGFSREATSFEHEHSIEVQLPFIQTLWGVKTPIVPICVSPEQLSAVQDAARALSKGLKDRKALIIASSDFTHYEPDSHARSADAAALEHVVSLDAPRFRQLCTDKHLTICGATAIEILMSIALDSHWMNVRTVQYATSGDVTGDLDAVVGYASVLMTKENYG